MAEFIKGRALSEGFFFDAAKPLLDAHFPALVYSAGLLGFGSDVLGYDDSTSAMTIRLRRTTCGGRAFIFSCAATT